MTDYTELQKAAAYAAQDTIKFADEDEEMRALQQFHEEVDPETVLALIAENERLRADCSSMRGSLKANAVSIKKLIKDGGRAARERDQLKAENERLEVEVKRMTSIAYAAHGAFRMETMAERDQLRAEVAGLKTGYEAYERVNAELKAEVGALRKDAERYRWLKSRPVNAPTSGPDLAQWDDHQGDALRGLFADEAIDAAMGHGEQS